jgi:hypothetical protein
MRAHATLLGDRILREFPALHLFDDPVSSRIAGLLLPCRGGIDRACSDVRARHDEPEVLNPVSFSRRVIHMCCDRSRNADFTVPLF